MKKKWIVLAPVMMVIFISIGGQAVLHLWNWLMPTMFGSREITFWQALGLLALCRILFGGFGGRGFHRSGFRRRTAGCCEQMTPEEREKLRRGVRSRFGDFGTPASGTKEPPDNVSPAGSARSSGEREPNNV